MSKSNIEIGIFSHSVSHFHYKMWRIKVSLSFMDIQMRIIDEKTLSKTLQFCWKSLTLKIQKLKCVQQLIYGVSMGSQLKQTAQLNDTK